MSRLEELRKQQAALAEQQKSLEKEIDKEYEVEIAKKRAQVSEKIAAIPDDVKTAILNLMTHSCASCEESDSYYHRNGFCHSTQSWRCNKCMMIEIFNGDFDGDFDFKLDSYIFATKI